MKEEKVLEFTEEQMVEISGGRNGYDEESQNMIAFVDRVNKRVAAGILPKEAFRELLELGTSYAAIIRKMPDGSEPYLFETFLKERGYDKFL